MNSHDELMDGAGVDPRDNEAMREALHDQLCVDAALTAHFGGEAAEARLRSSVMAAIDAADDAAVQQRVMRTVRVPRTRQTCTTGFTLAAAAAVVAMLVGWWLMHSPQNQVPVVTNHEPKVMPPVTVQPMPVTPTAKPVEQVVAHVEPKVMPPAPKPVVETPAPPPSPKLAPPIVAQVPLSPPSQVPGVTMTNTPPAVIAARPAHDAKPSLGTPPMAPTVPPVPKSAKRDAAHWPFSSTSPWNMPIGSEAKLEAIAPAEFATQTIGFQTRSIFIATPQTPFVRLKRTRGAAMKVSFADAWADALSMRAAPVTIIEPDGKWAIEYHGLTRSGADWSVADITRYALMEDGVERDGRGLGEAGLPALAGVIRNGEWQGGIHHVIAIMVPTSLLNAKAGGGKAYVWPAQPEQVPDISSFAKRGNLHLGSLLALPAEAHPKKLGFEEVSPQYQLALALWNHGACIVGSTQEGKGGISLITETLASGSMGHAELSRVFALLQVVTNNSARRPGGGGTPRGELAPAFDLPAK